MLVTPLVITNAKKLTTAVRDAQTSGASVAAGDNLLQVGLKEKNFGIDFTERDINLRSEVHKVRGTPS